MSLLYVFCIYFGIYGCFSSEPHCSKFSYDEQLLEKLVRMEFQMEKFEESNRLVVEALKADIVKLQTLIAENVKLQAFNAEHIQADIVRLQALKADVVKLQANGDDMADELTSIRKYVNTTAEKRSSQVQNLIGQDNAVVAFSAKTVSNTDPEDGETLVFTSVTTNKGNGYSRVTGEFTVPVDGLYLIHDQICVKEKKDFYHHIAVDDNPATKERFQANSDFPVCFTTVLTQQLQKGEKVSVKSHGVTKTGKRLVDDDNRWSMFSGVLLRET